MVKGMADLKKKLPVKINTLFSLASLSKTVTGTALMQLYDRGELTLEDDINKYLPFKIKNPNFPDNPITIRMLLTHTSSLLDKGKYVSSLYGCGDQNNLSFEQYLKNCYDPKGCEYNSANFGNYQPGESWNYCNSNYVLIACIIERISKKSFPEYCQQNLFNPLEMKESGWLLSDLDLNKIALNYISEANAKLEPDHPSIDHKSINGKNAVCHYAWPGYPDGGLNTSVPQLANFIMMFMNRGNFKGKQILKPETVDLILTPQKVKNMFKSPRWSTIDMGLTWWLRGSDTERYFSHSGGGTGIGTFAFFDPIKKQGAILFMTGEWHDKGYVPKMYDLLCKQLNKKLKK